MRPYIKGERFPDGSQRNVLKIGPLLIRRDGGDWRGWNYYWGKRWLGISAPRHIILNVHNRRVTFLLINTLSRWLFRIERQRPPEDECE